VSIKGLKTCKYYKLTDWLLNGPEEGDSQYRLNCPRSIIYAKDTIKPVPSG
jgi:hypothetical protein